MHCPRCNHEQQIEGSKFCNRCGGPMPSVIATPTSAAAWTLRIALAVGIPVSMGAIKFFEEGSVDAPMVTRTIGATVIPVIVGSVAAAIASKHQKWLAFLATAYFAIFLILLGSGILPSNR